jgi:hypothetical protein
LVRPIPNSAVKKNGKKCGEKKPKFFSNYGGDNYITAKHVGGQILKQLIYCCYTKVQQIHHKGMNIQHASLLNDPLKHHD